jgi:hypothetical protein
VRNFNISSLSSPEYFFKSAWAKLGMTLFFKYSVHWNRNHSKVSLQL